MIASLDPMLREVGCVAGLVEFQADENISGFDDDRSFSVWECVDVSGSPGLTRLIGALTIEECDIPSLDLSNLKSDDDRYDQPASDAIDLPDLLTSTKDIRLAPITVSSVDCIGYPSEIKINLGGLESNYSATEHWSKLSLQFELYPFPQSAQLSKTTAALRTFSSLCDTVFKAMESECKQAFKDLQTMESIEICNLVAKIDDISQTYYLFNEIRKAELWRRKMLKAMQGPVKFPPNCILETCLWIISCIRWRIGPRYALKPLEYIEPFILQFLQPTSELVLRFKLVQVRIFLRLERRKEVESIVRELLQLFLQRYGPKNRFTLSILSVLAVCNDAEPLFRISINFERQRRVYDTSRPYTDDQKAARTMWPYADDQNAARTMCELAWNLARNGKLEEASNVLASVKTCYSNVLNTKNWASFEFYYRKAQLMRKQNRMRECEEILCSLLQNYDECVSTLDIHNAKEFLARVLKSTGHLMEAETWYKKAFYGYSKDAGLLYFWTMGSCKYLGFFLAH